MVYCLLKTHSRRMLLVIIAMFSCTNFALAQESELLTIERAIILARANNIHLKSKSLEVERQKSLEKTSLDLPKTEFSWTRGQINTTTIDNSFNVTQSFSFPTVYIAQGKLLQEQRRLSETHFSVSESELMRDVKTAFYQLQYAYKKQQLLVSQDSIYSDFFKIASLKFATGETSYLESISARSHYEEIHIMKKQADADVIIVSKEFQKILNLPEVPKLAPIVFEKLSPPPLTEVSSFGGSTVLSIYTQRIQVTEAQASLETQKFLPDLSLSYFNQSIDSKKGFQGFLVGISVPIFFWSQQGKLQAANLEARIAESEYQYQKLSLSVAREQLVEQYNKDAEVLIYYDSSGLKLSDEILRSSNISYSKGDISYVEHIQNLSHATDIRLQYLEHLNQFNQTVINLQFLFEGK